MKSTSDLLKSLIYLIPLVLILSELGFGLPYLTSQWSSCFVQAQTAFKDITPELIREANCPIEIVGAKTELEVDGFGDPTAIRAYIDYKNVGEKPISAVKFRLGYFDAQGKLKSTFHAPDSKMTSVGQINSQKWRGEKIDPKTVAIKIRVLLVKYSDGSLWESEKIKQASTE